MSDSPSPACPPLSALLRLSDGEASARERRSLATHLWRCSSCRERLAAMEALAEECVIALGADVPAESTTEQFAAGLHEHIRAKSMRIGTPKRWLTAAIAIPTIALLFILSRPQTAVVQADALLARALQTEESMSSEPRVATLQWTPSEGAPTSAANAAFVATLPASAAASGQAAALERGVIERLRGYGIDVRQPLSVKSFVSWRNGLRGRKDTVRKLGEQLVLETTTADGRIRIAELAVHRDSYIVTRVSFDFDRVGRLSIEAGRSTAEALVDPSPVETAAVASLAAEREALDYAELRARLALREADADVGPSVRIVANASRAVIRMEGATSAEQLAKMRGLLSDVRQVELSLRVKPALPASAETASEPSSAVNRWLDRTYGPEDSEAKRRFIPDLRQSVALVGDRLEALNALSRRYPQSAVDTMPAAHRQLLQTLVDRHYRAMVETLNNCGTYVAVLSGGTPSLAVAQTATPRDWRSRTKRAGRMLRDMERLVARESPLDVWAEDSVERAALRSAFERLWNELNLD